MADKLAEIRAAVEAATQGKWEWRGRVAPDWMPDTFSAADDLRVQIATPEKDYDFDLFFVLQAMKPGFVMVRNADAELIANAPDYLRLLLPIAEIAATFNDNAFYDNEYGRCNLCDGEVDTITASVGVVLKHTHECPVKRLYDALKALQG